MLKDFEIEIKEELARVVTVKAETLGEAIDRVINRYKKGEIVLDAEDFKGHTVEPYDTQTIKR